jgi:hypothetical protein
MRITLYCAEAFLCQAIAGAHVGLRRETLKSSALGRRGEGRVVGNNAPRVRGADGESQEIFKWVTRKVEIRIDLESEAVVVPRLTQQYAARRSAFSQVT